MKARIVVVALLFVGCSASPSTGREVVCSPTEGFVACADPLRYRLGCTSEPGPVDPCDRIRARPQAVDGRGVTLVFPCRPRPIDPNIVCPGQRTVCIAIACDDDGGVRDPFDGGR